MQARSRRGLLALVLVAGAGAVLVAQQPPEEKGAAGASAAIGKPAPDFELKGTDDKTYKLADLKDKTVVIEWTSKDCPTCKMQLEPMKKSAEDLAKKGVIWLAIDSTAWHKLSENAEFVKEAKLPYPILDDSAGAVGKAFGAKRTPTMYVIHKGKLVYSGALVPAKGEQRNYVVEAVEAVLAGKEPPIAETKAYG